uniref:Reverse transcriptase domain-containing protein n=1 Tax=Tanacetum cinerariifolium TaxID=118510 RepID=A0A6L2JIT6_TANCI|nr:reverse transcriptase domain-containing protein [Tanacetum cinerariifolium]
MSIRLADISFQYPVGIAENMLVEVEEDFNAILDEGSKILYFIEGTLLKEEIFVEFDEFMAMAVAKVSESESDTKEPPLKRMPFGLCNAPATFQRCMLVIFHDMIEESVEVFMDDFSIFGDSFNKYLNNIDKMLQLCKDAYLVLNWKKCHFMVKERTILGHKVSGAGLEVDKAKINQTKVSKRKLKVVVSSESEGSDDELKKITALLAKAFNQKKLYSKPTNNNLGTYSATSLANKKQEYVMFDDKKEEKKVNEKKKDMSKVKCYNCKKEGHFAKDYKKAKVYDYEYYKTKMLLAKKDKDEQVLLAEDQAWMESSSDSNQEINVNIVFMAQIEKVLSDIEASSSSFDDKIAEVSYYTSESENESEYKTLDYYDNSTTYGLFVDNNDDQEIFHDSREKFLKNLIESQIDHNELDVTHNDYEDVAKLINQLIKEQTNQKIHMIIPSKDSLYNGKKGIGFENPSYFEKEKDLRPSVYDERVIGLGYTLMFLTHSDEALEIEKFKRARENKIEFAYDYENLNASYLNEKINFLDDYFQKIINPDFEKIDSPFQQTSSLKPYVLTIVQICLWIIDLGCSKYMMGNRAPLTNFVEKFLGTARIGNNDFMMIASYGDVVIGSMMIKKVYYVEGLGNNLFSVGQFYDKGLEVAFRKSTCFVRTKDGVDLLTGNRSSNLYTISLNEV